jgi:purine-nucleoside phosphorylase
MVISFAAENEFKSIKEYYEAERIPNVPFKAYSTKKADVKFVITGVGIKYAQDAFRKACKYFPDETLIISGTCGALKPGLNIGDIVIYKQAIMVRGERSSRYQLNKEIIRHCSERLRKAGLVVHSGVGLTTEKPLYSPAEKQYYGSKYNADVVDMESGIIFSIVKRKERRIMILRSVLDRVFDYLPDSEINVPLPQIQAESAHFIKAMEYSIESLKKAVIEIINSCSEIPSGPSGKMD